MHYVRESLASEPEMRLRRVGDLFHFTSCEAGYFTMRDSALFHCQVSIEYTQKGQAAPKWEQPAFLFGCETYRQGSLSRDWLSFSSSLLTVRSQDLAREAMASFLEGSMERRVSRILPMPVT